jgi:hypothetical protein
MLDGQVPLNTPPAAKQASDVKTKYQLSQLFETPVVSE